MKVVSLSGGRSSAMMLKILLDNKEIDKDTHVIFANTGQEHPKTLDFVNQMSKVWGVNITWVEYRNTTPFFEVVNYETAARLFDDNGNIDSRPFRELLQNKTYLPNLMKRFCTGDMKVKTIRRYLSSQGHKGEIQTFLGLRYDEPTRVAKKKESNNLGKEREFYCMPLYDLRVTKKERNEFWARQTFDLEIADKYGNCVGCFMKTPTALISIFRENPHFADFYIEYEMKIKNAKRKRNATFNKSFSYTNLLKVAKSQTQLPFFEYSGINCSCTD